MISKEQIAHDLEMVYMHNRYGIHITGSLYLNDGDGAGDVRTEHLPHTTDATYVKGKTGEKVFSALRKRKKFGQERKLTTSFLK